MSHDSKQQRIRFAARSQRGMSVVELLVALALSATLMAGVVGVFVAMFQVDRTQEGISRMQESARFALNFLGQDLRMAGYLGCSSTLEADKINNTLNGPPASFQPGRPIQGWEADNSDPGVINNSVANEAVGNTATSGWSTSGGNVLDSTRALPGTDIVRIWGADPTVEATLRATPPAAATQVNVTNTVSITDGDILLLSDCEHADLVQACNTQVVGGTPASLNLILSQGCTPGNIASLGLQAEAGTKVMKLGGTVYYIGKRDNVATNPPTLFRRQLSTTGIAGAAEELVEGIEDMQILYGEDTNNDINSAADRFVPADQVADWDDVVSVRISLLVQSLENNLVPTPQAYTFNGVVYNGASGNGAAPPDGRLRRTFTTTINLRNVTLGG
ncbi:MAG TPA: PilW family protein [Pseudomonadales bacterium]